MRRWRAPLLIAVLLAGTLSAYADIYFGVFGDSQPGGDWNYPVLSAIAADMAGRRLSVVLGTGDYIDGARNLDSHRGQWLHFFKGIAPLQQLGKVPVVLAPGNHDIRGSRAYLELFEQHFGPAYRSFDMNGCHFITLNTEEPGRAGMIGGEQLAWLKRDLAVTPNITPTFVAMHRPLWPVSIHVGESLDEYPEARDALHQLFVSEGVRCVFQGHEHLFNRQFRDGVEYIINGGAGGSLYARPDRGGFHHWVLAHVRDGKHTLQIRKIKFE
ncbi:MAG: metallophosphoesterase [Armatimonadetes bacterium]|nr:metallophosphoesterase [Armatimonadota bacterium]